MYASIHPQRREYEGTLMHDRNSDMRDGFHGHRRKKRRSQWVSPQYTAFPSYLTIIYGVLQFFHLHITHCATAHELEHDVTGSALAASIFPYAPYTLLHCPSNMQLEGLCTDSETLPKHLQCLPDLLSIAKRDCTP